MRCAFHVGRSAGMRALSIAIGLTLWVVAAAPTAQAQLFSTRLPTPYAGDYMNGVAASDVTGGQFTQGDRAQPIPAVGFGIPTAFGADWRDVYAAAGGHVGRSRGRWFRDGAVFMGAGLGDRRRLVGIETTFTVYALVGDTFEERSLSIKLHRRLNTRWAVAAGIENMMVTAHTDGGKSAYGVVSGSLPLQENERLFRCVTLTAGVGDGRFNAIENVRRGRNGVNVFGGVALQVVPSVSGFASWTGQDLNLGISFVPLSDWPFVVTPVLLDVGRTGHGARFAVSVGLGVTL